MEGVIMGIITISRQFGSGGRELGKRLADKLGYDYYDNEIVTAVARGNGVDEGYVEQLIERGFSAGFSFNFAKTLSYSPTIINEDSMRLYLEQHKVLREIAKRGNAVIVGRAADIILSSYKPFNVFVYADMESKVKRCIERASDGEDTGEKELIKKIKKIDAGRRKYYGIFSDTPWGDPENYHLMINTTGINIKEIIDPVAEYFYKYKF